MHLPILTPRGRGPALALAALLLLVGPGPAAAQYASGVELVEVYATVTEKDGRFVDDLAREDFEVREEGVLRPIAAFAPGELSLSVAVVIDRSFSMHGDPLRLAKSAAHRFLGELEPGDRAMLVAIGGDVETIVPLTVDRAALHEAIEALEPWGTTPIHDGIIQALDAIEGAPGRRVALLLTDGQERFSRATADAALDRARRSDVLTYPVILGNERSELLDVLADVTGGQSLLIKRPDRLAPAFSRIASELRYQYLLGYVPPSGGPDGYRRIDVRVKRDGVSVRARTGYYRP